MGDLSVFFFPFKNELNVLHINRQMRREALPLAYRRTVFRFGDIDDFIRIGVSIGRIGRDNIESLEFAWESKADSIHSYQYKLQTEDSHPRLPCLHVQKCIELLEHFKRLKYLYLYFIEDLILNISFDDFKIDQGIRGLCSLSPIDNVEIRSQDGWLLDEYKAARWLKETMESPEDKRML